MPELNHLSGDGERLEEIADAIRCGDELTDDAAQDYAAFLRALATRLSPETTTAKGSPMTLHITKSEANDLKRLENWREKGMRVLAVKEGDLPAILDWIDTKRPYPAEVSRLRDTLEGAAQAAHNASL